MSRDLEAVCQRLFMKPVKPLSLYQGVVEQHCPPVSVVLDHYCDVATESSVRNGLACYRVPPPPRSLLDRLFSLSAPFVPSMKHATPIINRQHVKGTGFYVMLIDGYLALLLGDASGYLVEFFQYSQATLKHVMLRLGECPYLSATDCTAGGVLCRECRYNNS